MRSFLARHLGVILTGTAINLPFIWRGLVWLTDWLARYDYWATHGPEFAKVGDMIGFIANPPPWLIFVTIPVAIAIILWDVRYPNTLRNLRSVLPAPKNRMALCLGLSIAFLLLGGGFGFAAYWQYKYPPPPTPVESELFKAARDSFQHSGGIAEQEEVVSGDRIGIPPITVKIWVRSDLISMAKYLVFYIPRASDMPSSPPLGGINYPMRQTYDAVKQMADRFADVIKRVDATGSAGIGDMGADNMRYSTEAIFAGAIYLYYEGDLTDAERVDLRAIYASRGARLFFRGWRYLRESRPPVTH